MSSLTGVPSIPDLTFNFNDSCNCCMTCCCRKPSPNMDLYVNKTGELEKYKKSKARDKEISLKRSQGHLLEAIINKINSFDGNVDECLKNLDNVMNSITHLNTIKKAHIDHINEIMLETFNKKASEEKEYAASKGTESQDEKSSN